MPGAVKSKDVARAIGPYPDVPLDFEDLFPTSRKELSESAGIVRNILTTVFGESPGEGFSGAAGRPIIRGGRRISQVSIPKAHELRSAPEKEGFRIFRGLRDLTGQATTSLRDYSNRMQLGRHMKQMEQEPDETVYDYLRRISGTRRTPEPDVDVIGNFLRENFPTVYKRFTRDVDYFVNRKDRLVQDMYELATKHPRNDTLHRLLVRIRGLYERD